MNSIFQWIDLILISMFRIIDIPVLGYYLGTFIICAMCVIVGRFTLILGSRINGAYLKKDHGNMVHMHNLSLYALVNKDKTSYSICNKEANDAFGKIFFSNIALGSSALWPVPFALAWMQYRFGQVFDLPVKLPGLGNSVGFLFTFFPILVLAFIVCGYIFRLQKKIMGANKTHQDYNTEQLLSLRDITERTQGKAC